MLLEQRHHLVVALFAPWRDPGSATGSPVFGQSAATLSALPGAGPAPAAPVEPAGPADDEPAGAGLAGGPAAGEQEARSRATETEREGGSHGGGAM